MCHAAIAQGITLCDTYVKVWLRDLNVHTITLRNDCILYYSCTFRECMHTDPPSFTVSNSAKSHQKHQTMALSPHKREND